MLDYPIWPLENRFYDNFGNCVMYNAGILIKLEYCLSVCLFIRQRIICKDRWI